MKCREIIRFEFIYQVRRVSTWLFFAVLLLSAFVITREDFLVDARSGDHFLNAPFVIALVTVIGSLIWLLVAAAIAGEAAARDAQTRMHPLMYTAPVRKAEYLGGRFLAAFALNALILLAVPVGVLLAMYSPGVEAQLLGPFRPAAHLTAYAFIALPNAFIATAIQYSVATLSRRSIASYLASVLLFVTANVLALLVARLSGLNDLGKLLDPLGGGIVVELAEQSTAFEKNTRLIALEGMLLWNRLLWIGIALAALAFTGIRFRCCHHTPWAPWNRVTRRRDAENLTPATSGIARSTPITALQGRRAFGWATSMRQSLAIAWISFGSIAKSRSGILLLTLVGMLAILSVLEPLRFMGVPLLPRTDYVLHSLTIPAIPPAWIIIPLLIIFWSGELVWREREAGLSEIVDAAPVAEWVLFLGKFLGLGLVLVACMALRMMSGVLVQAGRGYHEFEFGLYLQILFGLQLADYLLLALLALVLHVVVNQRHVGHLVTLVFYVLIAVASAKEIGHNLLVYGSDPGVFYTDMRGFGAALGPWLWFKLYWTAWALLLALIARLLWVRGRDEGLGGRLRIARRRCTRPTTVTTTAAVAGILAVGGFILYNTNVLNGYETADDRAARHAQYERRYARYDGIPQPRLKGTSLNVEIYPDRQKAEIRGTYRLVNNSGVPIDSIHLATASEVETAVTFDRPARLILADEELGHRIYNLDTPLPPGDSLGLDFEVRFEPRGFRNNGILPSNASVTANGTFFTNLDWLPVIGYQANRELSSAGDRQAHGLAPRPTVRSLYDAEAHRGSIGKEQTAFEAVVGTAENQVAVAPGALRRTWSEDGRRYFRYTTDAAIGNEYAIFSADYAVHEGRWKNPDASGQDVTIRIFHHRRHTANLERMLRSARASLGYYIEHFGPYPQRHISLVERPGHGLGMHAEASMIAFSEGFTLLYPEGNPQGPDLLYSVVAHEVAHQWWGSYLVPARVEGNLLIAEGLAQYSAMRVVKKTYGPAHVRRLVLSQMRSETEKPRTRADVPLIRGTERFHGYRKGPFAMYAMSEYIGEQRVNLALRRLLEQHDAGSLLTSLDLLRELQAVTPDSLQYLLHDLFQVNTFWDLETEQATAEQTEEGHWKVTIDVWPRKVAVDPAGVDTNVPMDDWVQVGVFAAEGDGAGEPIYLQNHRVRAGQQTIKVTVPRKPARAGIDPYHLLDWETDSNLEEITFEG